MLWLCFILLGNTNDRKCPFITQLIKHSCGILRMYLFHLHVYGLWEETRTYMQTKDGWISAWWKQLFGPQWPAYKTSPH